MGKITDALKKATEERLSRMEKLDTQEQVKYEFIAKKTVDSKIDPRIVAFYDPQSPVTEQYRTLRTNLQALNKDKPAKTICISSSLHGEGKSISAINLCITMAKDLNKKKILLVDADLRRSRIHKYLGINHEVGLSELLTDGTDIDNTLIKINEVENLTILPAGKTKHNPAELLGAVKMRNFIDAVKTKFDYIVFDTPPVIPVTDAGVIGAHTDGIVMVVQATRTQKGVLKHSESLLRQAQAKLLGYILTNIQYHIPAYIYRYL